MFDDSLPKIFFLMLNYIGVLFVVTPTGDWVCD
jgi:hypothetical protein